MPTTTQSLADALLSSIEAGDMIAETRGNEMHFRDGKRSFGHVRINLHEPPVATVVSPQQACVTASPGESHHWMIDTENALDTATIVEALHSCIASEWANVIG